jgi:hypothetical protein
LESTRRRRVEPISNRMAWPPPTAPADHDRLDGVTPGVDKPVNDARRLGKSTDRLASLKSYRRARGLCDRCAEKWFRGHKCPNTVQLQVIEEVWDLLDEPDDSETVQDTQPQLLMTLSDAAWTGKDAVSTLRFQGNIQQHPLMILIDSGSTHSFISDRFLSLLTGTQPLQRPMAVRVANGQIVTCSQHLPQATWSMATYQFVSDFIFLPLPSVDLVVGMDWLQHYSPMHIDWYHKWITIPYQGTYVSQQGMLSTLPVGAVIELRLFSDSPATTNDPQQVTADNRVQAVLSQFTEVFEDPIGLPPTRQCDHAIPLLPGANPFAVRPYRYPPALKDEIETQVQQMLDQGVIQKS